MLEIHRKVRADEAVTDAEWPAWKAWRGIEEEEEEEEEASSQVLFLTLCPHLVFWTVFYVPCGYLLIRQSWRLFGRFLRCLGCPGSTGNAFCWEMASRTRF